MRTRPYLALAFCYCVVFSSNTAAQSLVPNGSFEELTIDCLGSASYYDLVGWSQPACAFAPGYLHVCSGLVPESVFGHQTTYDGLAFMSVSTLRMNVFGFPDGNPRSYASIDLIEPLAAGEHYCLSLQMNMADSSNYKTGALHAFLWYNVPTVCGDQDEQWDDYAAVTFDITEVDSVEWTLLEGEFTATGGESNLTLGAFQFGEEIDSVFLQHDYEQEFEGAFYFIDDVRLWPCQVGLVDPERPTAVQVYPNPVVDRLRVSANRAIRTYAIADAQGRTLSNALGGDPATNSKRLEIPVTSLAPGRYTLTLVHTTGERSVHPFIVIR
jgi:hypothetical protein